MFSYPIAQTKEALIGKINVLFLASIIAVSSFSVRAETPAISNLSQEKIEAMNELYKVSKIEEQILFSMQQLPEMLALTFAQQASEAPPAEFMDILNRSSFIAMRSALIESGVLMEAFIMAQAEFYSVAEIQKLIEFYKSPVGQKFADSSPTIGPKLQQLMMPALINFQNTVGQVLVEEAEKFCSENSESEFCAEFLEGA